MEKRLAEIIIFLSFQAEQSQANILETALANEKDNFHRLKVALDTERMRSREAIDRDNDTILDLRTALEVRVFHKLRYCFCFVLNFLTTNLTVFANPQLSAFYTSIFVQLIMSNNNDDDTILELRTALEVRDYS